MVHGSISASQSLNRYSYVQCNPIKLTDPFGLSPLDRLNWKNVGHAILNGLGMIPVVGEAFDMANAIWYAKDGQYGMTALSLMSALPMIGNVASGVMTAAKLTTAAKIVSTACKVVSNAATFTQAAVGGISNAASIGKNILNGKLFSEDTAKNLVSFGINAFTAATSGKNLLSSSKELKKAVGDGVGNKWSRKAGKEPLLEYNLQFFAESSGVKSIKISEEKMYQQGQHYNKHGRDMGYSSKKEYETAAREFFVQNKETSDIYEGIWNSSRGGQSGQRQIIIRKNGKQLIINKESGQIIDFYNGTSLDGFINIERVQ